MLKWSQTYAYSHSSCILCLPGVGKQLVCMVLWMNMCRLVLLFIVLIVWLQDLLILQNTDSERVVTKAQGGEFSGLYPFVTVSFFSPIFYFSAFLYQSTTCTFPSVFPFLASSPPLLLVPSQHFLLKLPFTFALFLPSSPFCFFTVLLSLLQLFSSATPDQHQQQRGNLRHLHA